MFIEVFTLWKVFISPYIAQINRDSILVSSYCVSRIVAIIMCVNVVVRVLEIFHYLSLVVSYCLCDQ